MIEPLEQRRLFDGNINVSFVDGQLRIIGDDQANEFSVFQQVNSPSIKFQGGDGTTIDGRLHEYFQVSSLSNLSSIDIEMGGGNDSARFTDSLKPVRMHIDLGRGDDTFDLANEDTGATDIYGGSGQNQIIVGSRFTGRLRIFPGDDADVTSLILLIAKRGFQVDDSGAQSVVKMDTVRSYGDSVIESGNSPDQVTIAASVFNALNVYLRGGDDRLVLRNDIFKQPSILDGGTGVNSIHRQNVSGTLDRQSI